MNFRFDNILEEWAQLYKPLSHDPQRNSRNCAFYRIKAINQENTLFRNMNTAKSPCMAYSIIVDAEMQKGKINYQHVVYFFSRAVASTRVRTAKDDEVVGMDQQLLMDKMCRDLLTYLKQIKQTGKNPVTGEVYDRPTFNAFRGLQLDSAQWSSNPGVVKLGEWHVMGLIIPQNAALDECLDDSLYKKE